MRPRVVGAFLVGTALVAGAFVLSRFGQSAPVPDERKPTTGISVVAAGDTSRQYIPSVDSNNDGIPDWQEMLTKADPIQLAAETTEYQPPETLTDQFAVQFFEDMLRNEQYGTFGSSPEELIAQTSDEVRAHAYDVLLTEADITISEDTSPEAIRFYANAVAQSSLIHSLPGDIENEAVILERAIAQNDPALLTELDPIIAVYENLVADLSALPAPRNMTKEHLDLLNAYRAIHEDIKTMRVAFTDPLLALLRIQRYQDDATGLAIAYTNLFAAADARGAQFRAGDATLQVVKFNE